MQFNSEYTNIETNKHIREHINLSKKGIGWRPAAGFNPMLFHYFFQKMSWNW